MVGFFGLVLLVYVIIPLSLIFGLYYRFRKRTPEIMSLWFPCCLSFFTFFGCGKPGWIFCTCIDSVIYFACVLKMWFADLTTPPQKSRNEFWRQIKIFIQITCKAGSHGGWMIIDLKISSWNTLMMSVLQPLKNKLD